MIIVNITTYLGSFPEGMSSMQTHSKQPGGLGGTSLSRSIDKTHWKQHMCSCIDDYSWVHPRK